MKKDVDGNQSGCDASAVERMNPDKPNEKMKTIRQHLESLPSELSRKAVRAAEMTAPQMLTARIETARAAIQKGIVWAKTVEGYAFWNAIHSEA